MDNLHLRPKHARWVKFLQRESDLNDAAYEADCKMADYTGISCFDDRIALRHTESKFASRFGIGLGRAIDQLIDLYGFKTVASFGFGIFQCNNRLYAWCMEQPFEELSDFTF